MYGVCCRSASRWWYDVAVHFSGTRSALFFGPVSMRSSGTAALHAAFPSAFPSRGHCFSARSHTPQLLSAGAESVDGRCRCHRSCSYVSSFCGYPCCCPQAQNQYVVVVVVVGRVRMCPHFVVIPVAIRRRRISMHCVVVFVSSSCGHPVAVNGRRISRHASGKQSLSAVPPTIYRSGVLSRTQVMSIRPLPQVSQNTSY